MINHKIITEVLNLIEDSSKPVIKIYADNIHSKILAIGMRKGTLLKEHKTSSRASIIVTKGIVCYTSTNTTKTLSRTDQFAIPMGEMHAVSAIEDALFLLTISK